MPNIIPDRSVPVHGITQLMATGLLPLARLHVRPLQRHCHSLGLTNWFSPPHRSDPLVLANLHRQWQDLSFLTSGNPIWPFQAEFTIFTDSTQSWGAHIGEYQISGIWTRSEVRLHINVLELKVVVLVMIATDNTTVVAYINKQEGGGHSHTLLQLAVDLWLRYSQPGQTHSGLPKCDNRLVISRTSPSRQSGVFIAK